MRSSREWARTLRRLAAPLCPTLFLALGAAGLAAQTPSATDTLSYPFEISKADLSLWAPGTTGGSSSAHLFSAGLGSSTSAGSTYTPVDLSSLGISSPKFGGSFSFSTSGSIGSSASAAVSGGSFSFDYPGTLRIIIPAPNTFGSAVPAVIRSEVMPAAGGDLKVTTAPTPTFSLNSSFGAFSARMDGGVCFVSCSGSLSSLFRLPSLSLPAASGSLLGLTGGWFTLAGEKVFPLTESVSDLQNKVKQDSVLVTRESYTLPDGSYCSSGSSPGCSDLESELAQEQGTQIAFHYLYLDNSVVPPGSSFCKTGWIPSTYQETKAVEFFLRQVVTWTLSAGNLPEDRCVVSHGSAGEPASQLNFDPLQQLGINGTLEAPSFHLSTTLQNGALVGTGDNQFGDLTLATLRLLGTAAPELDVLSYGRSASKDFSVPDIISADASANIDYDLIDLKQDVRLSQDQTLKLTPAFHIAITLPAAANWTVLDHGSPVANGTGNAVFEPGQDLEVFLPDTTPRSVVPRVTILPAVDDDVGFTLSGDTRYKSLFGKIDWSAYVSDDVTNTTLLDWSHSVGFGPAVNNEIPGSSFSREIPAASAHFSLDPVNGPKLGAFTLDPENPIIAVSTSLANSVWTTGTAAGTVTQTIDLANRGDVPLHAVDLLNALAASGLDVNLIQSFDMTVNASFNGRDEAEALTAGQTIPVGDSAKIVIRWKADPGRHSMALHAEGTSPIGTRVTADTTDAFGWYAMDVKPGQINARAQGETPVAVYGSAGLPVSDIDRSTLTLEGQAPEKIQVSDLNGDGLPDLMLHFGTQALVTALENRIAAVAAAASQTGLNLAAPSPFTAQQVADALFGGVTSGKEAMAMDRAGNGNGRLDLGDLRAAALGARSAAPPASAGAAAGLASAAKGNSSASTGAYTLVLNGNLKDGTEFWGEDSVTVKGVTQ